MHNFLCKPIKKLFFNCILCFQLFKLFLPQFHQRTKNLSSNSFLFQVFMFLFVSIFPLAFFVVNASYQSGGYCYSLSRLLLPRSKKKVTRKLFFSNCIKIKLFHHQLQRLIIKLQLIRKTFLNN